MLPTIQYFSFDGCADTCVDGLKPQPNPKPNPSNEPQPRPTPTPQPVVFEEENIETVINQVIKSTRGPNPPRRTTPPAPTTYRQSLTTPQTTTGYSYETPDPGLPYLYGPPAQGRRGRRG